MKSQLTGKTYTFEIGEGEMDSLLRTEALFAFRTLADRMSSLPGVCKVSYGGQAGPNIAVEFEVGKDGEAIGFDDARDLLEIHLIQCEAFDIYVGNGPDAARSRTLLQAGDGFVLCDVKSKGKDLGVSLHFLDGGERQTKWFTDGAAQQFRELAEVGDARRIRAIVAKHIDLDPAPGLRR